MALSKTLRAYSCSTVHDNGKLHCQKHCACTAAALYMTAAATLSKNTARTAHYLRLSHDDQTTPWRCYNSAPVSDTTFVCHMLREIVKQMIKIAGVVLRKTLGGTLQRSCQNTARVQLPHCTRSCTPRFTSCASKQCPRAVAIPQ